MKKLLLIDICFCMLAANAQMVTTTIDNVTETTITASFEKSANCNSFSYMIGSEGELDSWAMMMQTTVASLVDMWGVSSTTSTSYTWTEQAPGTHYYIYVNAHGSTDSLYQTSVYTLSAGGSGTSIITIEVSEITHNQARVICTPNSETALFKDMLMTVDYYNEIGADSALAMLKGDFYTQYETDDWTWLDLLPETNYYALAIGQNASGVWGELAMEQFATTADGFAEQSVPDAAIYPNPVFNNLSISFANPTDNSRMQLFSIDGQLISEYCLPSGTTRFSLDASNLADGVYLLKSVNSVLRFVKQ